MVETKDKISIENVVNTENVLELLSNLETGTITAQNINTVLAKAANSIAEYFDAEHTYIMLKNKDGQLENAACSYRNCPDDSMVTASQIVTEKVTETGSGILVTNAMNSPDFPGDPNFQRFNIGSAICAAIKTAGSTFGLIYADSTTCDKWDDVRLKTLEFAGEHIGLAVNSIHSWEENKRLLAAGQATLNLSHSVKNILQMVGGASEVIDFGLRSNQIHRVKKSWDILKPNLQRLRKFTLDMLDYSKERKLEPEPCDFNRVIQEAIESLKSQLKQKKSKLHIRIDQKIPTIELDGERIHEMSLNLILNAIDIVDQDTGIVRVETKYLPDKQEVELSVNDNGPGISEEMKEKIFTPFESGKNKFGTGLGMPIAKQVIEQHQGRVEIESKPGQGTTFRIFLPAKVTG